MRLWQCSFAQAIVNGLASDKPNGKNTAKAAYLAAGYSTSTEHAGEVNASRLLRKAEPVIARIRELQEQALPRIDRKLDISRERIGRRLDLASRMTESENKPETIVSSELGLTKLFAPPKSHYQYHPNPLNNPHSPAHL